MATLDEDSGAALRGAVRADLPIGDNGTVALTARAWTVHGRVPG